MRKFSAVLLVLVLGIACSTSPKSEPAREPAAAATLPSCADFTRLTALDKYNAINRLHNESAASFLVDGTQDSEAADAQSATDRFKARQARRVRVAKQLLASANLGLSTTSFLVPATKDDKGWHKLNHTLRSRCDFLEPEQQKKPKLVHGLASMAPAHIEFYPELIRIDAGYKEGRRVPNPWTGLLDPKGKGTVRLFIRFSLANPVFGNVKLPEGLLDDPNIRDLKLEFIPGLGMKFLVDGQPNFDVVAMESLAGQRSDQNYFKYDFSPDFSRHAPPPYMVRDWVKPSVWPTDDQKDVKSRYHSNPANLGVMALVGFRFEQSMADTIKNDKNNTQLDPYRKKRIDRSGRYGPHPFMLGIDGMVGTTVTGEKIANFKRPFRLVFEPATGEISDKERLAAITSSVEFKPGLNETDFRSKLAHLEKDDPIYYITGETESGKRYRIGKIVLDASPMPSFFQDRVIFVNHEIDTARLHDRLMIEERTRGGGEIDITKFRIVDPEPEQP